MRSLSLLACAGVLALTAGNALAADKDVVVLNTPLPVTVTNPVTGTVSGTVNATVTNTNANPVPVALTNPASATVLPYQSTSSVADSSTCVGQCFFTFAPVPAGKRLVVQVVSGQVPNAARNVLFEPVASFVAIPSTAQGYFTQPTTMYYEPGSTPTARVFAGFLPPSSSLVVTLVGMLVPAN